MYLTFQDVDVEIRKSVLCWAVQVLQSIATEKNMEERMLMIDRIEEFLKKLDKSVKDIDMTIRHQQKAIDSLRAVRIQLVQNLSAFRDKDDEIIHVEASEEVTEGCVATIKTTGKRCGNRVTDSEDLCGIHKKR
jgi:hypothetical protein